MGGIVFDFPDWKSDWVGGKKMINLLLGGLIAVYCIWVICKKYKDRKSGKCCCGCGGGCDSCNEKEKIG